MNLAVLLQGLGSIGFFSSRAFLPAFVTALTLRFGPEIPWVAQLGLLRHVSGVPTWFTSDPALIALGVLSILELVAERVPEARMVLDEVHDYLKTGMAILTYLGVLGASDQKLVEQTVQQSANLVSIFPALVIGAGTYLLAVARRGIVGFWEQVDEDDDLGVRGLLCWVEDLWGGLGPIALVIFPLLTIAMLGLALGLIAVARWRVEAREEAAKVPCAHCGEPIPAPATICPVCRAQVEAPRAVGWLGQPLQTPADPVTHSFQLVAVKRCPACATRLPVRAIRQTCGACGYQLMSEAGFVRGYIAFIDRRVPAVCGLCFLLGLIPIVGVVPGVIVYRLGIVAPFRRYIPPGRNFLLRWGIRLVVLLLVALQWLPLLGGFVVPAMALINYLPYREAYRRAALGPEVSE